MLALCVSIIYGDSGIGFFYYFSVPGIASTSAWVVTLTSLIARVAGTTIFIYHTHSTNFKWSLLTSTYVKDIDCMYGLLCSMYWVEMNNINSINKHLIFVLENTYPHTNQEKRWCPDRLHRTKTFYVGLVRQKQISNFLEHLIIHGWEVRRLFCWATKWT